MEKYVKFLRGTPAAFDKLSTKDKDTLYFISETDATSGLLYLGNKLISGGSASDISECSIGDLKDVIIDSANITNNSLLVYDWATKTWVNKSIDEVVVSIMTGATASTDGSSGMVPAPKAGEQDKFLRGDGTWANAGMTDEEKAELSKASADISSLVGDSANQDGSIPSIEEIATKTLTKALIPDDAKESLDTLEEIADWIQNHPDDAAAMNTKIGSLEKEVKNLKTDVEDLTTVIYDDSGDGSSGLLTKVNSLWNPASQADTPYVLLTTYNTQVGDINKLTLSSGNTTIIDEINTINQRLTWVDMSDE